MGGALTTPFPISRKGRLATPNPKTALKFDPATHNRLEAFALTQRKNPSPAELAIYPKMVSLGFLWQQPLSPFLVDFYHRKLRLAVEVDGKFHQNQRKEDQERDDFLLQRYGVTVVRFPAAECLNPYPGGKPLVLRKLVLLVKERRSALKRLPNKYGRLISRECEQKV